MAQARMHGDGHDAVATAINMLRLTKQQSYQEVYSDGIQVIGAGFGRQGTTSLQVALQQLYGAPCYHMGEVTGKQHAGFFLDLVNKKVTDEKIREHFRAYACTTNAPASLFWEDLLRVYPDAKVVLTVRDFEGWYKSCCETVFITAPGSPIIWWGIWLLQHLSPPWIKWARMMWKVWYGHPAHIAGDFSKANVERHYNAWNQSVIDKCPKDKLLVFDVKQGWEPLCKFLGKPVPDTPFPNVNDTAVMRAKYRIKNAVGYGLGALGVVGVAIAVQLVRSLS